MRALVSLATLLLLASACTPQGAERRELRSGEEPPVFAQQDKALLEQLEQPDAAGWRHSDVIAAAERFDRIGVRFDAPAGADVEVRSSEDGISFGLWQAVEVTFAEDQAHNGRADFSQQGLYVQFRLRWPEDQAMTFLAMDTLLQPEAAEEDEDEAIASTRAGLASDGVAVSRAAYGARRTNCPNRHTPNRISVHHTVTPNNDRMAQPARARQIQAYFMDVRGYCDSGYHFLVGQDGQVYQSRLETLRGAHIRNQNQNNIGVSFVGDFTSIAPSAAMMAAGARIIHSVATTYNIPIDRQHIRGHREQGQTACPGNTFYPRLGQLVDMARALSQPQPPPPPPTNVPPSTAGCQGLQVNQQLLRGQQIISCGGTYRLAHQNDGNVVLYNQRSGRAVWSTGTNNRATRTFVMQGDGNLVLYDGSNRPLWYTATHGNPGTVLALWDDGRLILFGPQRPLWATDTQWAGEPGCGGLPSGASLAPGQGRRSCNGKFLFVHQTDGNVVLYQGQRALWNSGTNGRSTRTLAMQGDGNLVLYDTGGRAPWFTSTHGNAGASLAIQDDGNVVLRAAAGRTLWSTRTGG